MHHSRRRFKKSHGFDIDMKELLKQNDWCKGLKANAKLVEGTSIYVPSELGWDPRSGKPRPSAKPLADSPPSPKALPLKPHKRPAALPATAVRRPSGAASRLRLHLSSTSFALSF